MLTWVFRSFTVLAWLAFTAAGVWALGLHRGALPPYTGVLVLGWTGVAALWGRALTLPALRRGTGRAAEEPAPAESAGAAAVWMRHSAALLALIVATAALTVIGTASGDGTVRAVKEAGPVVTSGTVVEVAQVRARYERKKPKGYRSTLLLRTPDGTRITARDVETLAEPHTGKTYEVLWAPSAPELGGFADPRFGVSKYLDDRWGWTVTSWAWLGAAALFILCIMLPLMSMAGTSVLHRLARQPLPQFVQAAVVTVLFLGLQRVLTGAVDRNLASSPIGGLALLVTAGALMVVARLRSPADQ
ncbi:hypothetical protein [Streptomyces sp. AP-93]|uniref:hypothetical protein n=1 Tax=Streptomyces sp. AP-93 TaxID=2929048 RepID=UPI001FAEF02F|nr:hypothetical protein [Streptomyces sp. AP-93]MCJ0867972.1 hypothetical protein [Streptomyces sp. AP-93]